MVSSRATAAKYDAGLSSTRRLTSSPSNGVEAGSGRDREEARLARWRCLCFCVLLFVPAVVLLYLIAGRGLDNGRAWAPEPRRDLPSWRQVHQAYVREVRDTGKDLKLVFYGDSITEAWRGSSRGKAVPRAVGIPEVWEKYFGEEFGGAATAFGISGDYTKHLMWRLMHGEMTSDMAPNVVVLLIGTNDLTECELYVSGCNVVEHAVLVAKHVADIVQYIHTALPQTHIVLNAVFPRASRFKQLDAEPDSFYEQPSLYTQAINVLNTALKHDSQEWPWVTFLDCSSQFLAQDSVLLSKRSLDRALMPDGLHPSDSGSAKWAECMLPVIREHMVPGQQSKGEGEDGE